MLERMSPLQALLSAFIIASFGGLATLLRSNKPITLRAVGASFLYSGIIGLVIALLWYNYFEGQGNVFFLLGVSGLAGIGGTTAADFLIQVLKNGGIQVNITPQSDAQKPATSATQSPSNNRSPPNP